MKLIKEEIEWNEALSRFSRTPITYNYQYHKAHLFTDKSYLLAFSRDDFFLPLIVNHIEGDLYDSESVFGGTGALWCSESILEDALKEVSLSCKELGIINSFIRWNPFLNSYKAVKNKDSVVVPLSGEFPYSERQKRFLKQASNLTVSHDPNLLPQFYELYINTMKDVNAPSFFWFKESYFESLKNNLGDNFKLISVMNGSEVIAAATFLISPTYLTYHFAGSSEIGKKLRANNLLIHQGCLLGKELEREYLDLGGGLSSNNSDSLFLFKSGFSKETKPTYQSYLVHNESVHSNLCENWRKKHPEIKESKFFQVYRLDPKTARPGDF